MTNRDIHNSTWREIFNRAAQMECGCKKLRLDIFGDDATAEQVLDEFMLWLRGHFGSFMDLESVEDASYLIALTCGQGYEGKFVRWYLSEPTFDALMILSAFLDGYWKGAPVCDEEAAAVLVQGATKAICANNVQAYSVSIGALFRLLVRQREGKLSLSVEMSKTIHSFLNREREALEMTSRLEKLAPCLRGFS